MTAGPPETSGRGPLRILQLVDTLDSGGMEQQLVSLMNRLDPTRHHFEVCCLRHAGVNAAKLAPGIPVHALHKPEGFKMQAVHQIRALLRRNFDLVHSHNIGPLIYAALATNGGLSTPIFHGEHAQFTPAEFSFKRLWQRRLLYRCTSAVHTVSAGQRDELLRAGVQHLHLTAIQNGVNTQRFLPAADATERNALRARLSLGGPDDLCIGIVARFGAFKRHAELIRAFELLAETHPKLRLIMVGDGGPEKERILQQAGQSSSQARIHWAGYQSDPTPYYQVMDLLAVPSSNEGLSNTTLEAMACAVPVLSNDICGSRELLPLEGEGGWVRDLTTVEKLAAELQRLLTLPLSEWQQVGQLGRQRASTKFSWSAMADHYADWFRACAGQAAFPQ